MKSIKLKPVGGTRGNLAAVILRIVGIIIWILGFKAGIEAGETFGKIGSFLRNGLNARDEFEISYALVVWLVTFSMGMLLFAFAEVISLLQQGVTIEYHGEYEAPKIEVPTATSEKGKTERATEKKPESGNYITKFKFSDEDQPDAPFKLRELYFYQEGSQQAGLSLAVGWHRRGSLQGIMGDLSIKSSFGDSLLLQDVSFTGFEKENLGLFKSGTSLCNIQDSLARSISSARFIVKKYVIDGKMEFPVEGGQTGRKYSGGMSEEDFIDEISEMRSAIEIKKYVDSLASEGEEIISDELVSLVNNYATIERSYGNQFVQAFVKIKEFFGYETSAGHQPSKAKSPDASSVANQGRGKSSFCTKCGKAIGTEGSVFCPICGTRLVHDFPGA